MAHTKRFKANITIKPNPNGTTAQPPTTISKAPTEFKIQSPSQEETPENRPPPLVDDQSMQAPHGQRQGKCQKIFLKQEKTGYCLPII